MAQPAFYLRCPHCGDSWKHPNKTHLAVYKDGGYHCFRCKTYGQFTIGEMLHYGFVQSEITEESRFDPLSSKDGTLEVEEITGLGPLARYSSVVRRYKLREASLPGYIEVFEARTRKGEVTGYHLRPSWDKKATRSMGSMLLGFSTPVIKGLSPVRLVEGPYDAIYPEDVCLWGMPNIKQLSELKFIPLIICPDGDVWEDWTKYLAWMGPLLKANSLITGGELILKGKDPDEVSVHDRIRLSQSQLLEPYWVRNRNRPEKPLDVIQALLGIEE